MSYSSKDQVTTADLKEPLLSGSDYKHAQKMRKDSAVEKVFTKFWILFAAASGILFGTNNFFLDLTINQMDGYRVMLLTGFGMLTYYVGYHIVQAIMLYQKKGTIWSKEDSYYFKEDGSVDMHLIKLFIIRYSLSIGSTINIIYVFSTAISARVSTSVIISLFSGTVFITSFAFYLVFNERLLIKHYGGMIMLIFSVIFIANSQQDSTVHIQIGDFQTDIEFVNQTSILVPISLVFLGCCFYASNTLIARQMKYKHFPPLQYSADSMIFTAFITTSLFWHQHFFVQPYTFKESWPVVTGSFFIVLGALFLNGATAYGKAGPTQALCQLQSPFQLLLEIIIYQRAPNSMGIIGMAFGLAGALVIMLWRN